MFVDIHNRRDRLNRAQHGPQHWQSRQREHPRLGVISTCCWSGGREGIIS